MLQTLRDVSAGLRKGDCAPCALNDELDARLTTVPTVLVCNEGEAGGVL